MICPSCGNEFTPTVKYGYVAKFCSRPCANRRKPTETANKARSEKLLRVLEEETSEQRAARMSKAHQTLRDRFSERARTANFDELGETLRRRRIMSEQNNRCAMCSMEPTWNGKPLGLHLDHIDGNRANETRGNLRLICPNCHSQTDTYCSKNVRRVSDEELLQAVSETASLNQALKKVGLQRGKANYERIKRLLE